MRWVSWSALACFAVGCAGGIDDPAPFIQARSGASVTDAGAPAPACPDVERELLTAHCGACHSAMTKSGGLDLSSPSVVSRLVGVASSGCAGKKLVNAADPTTGVLFEKLTPTPSCGSPMPPVGAPLTASEVDCLKGFLRKATGT